MLIPHPFITHSLFHRQLWAARPHTPCAACSTATGMGAVRPPALPPAQSRHTGHPGGPGIPAGRQGASAFATGVKSAQPTQRHRAQLFVGRGAGRRLQAGHELGARQSAWAATQQGWAPLASTHSAEAAQACITCGDGQPGRPLQCSAARRQSATSQPIPVPTPLQCSRVQKAEPRAHSLGGADCEAMRRSKLVHCALHRAHVDGAVATHCRRDRGGREGGAAV